MPTIVNVEYSTPDTAIVRLRAALDDVRLRDPSWNGADFEIEKGEFTCIENTDGAVDEYKAAALLNEVVYPALFIDED